MESVIEQSLSVNLKVMQFFGLYSSEQQSFIQTMKAYIIYVTFIIVIPSLGIAFIIKSDEFELEKVNDNALVVIVEMMCQITKLLPFIRKSEELKMCIHYFDSPFFAVTKTKQKNIINKCSQVCRRNTTIYLIFVIGCNLFWSTKPLFSEKRKFPIDVWLPYDAYSKLTIFVPTYLTIAMAIIYSSFSCAAVDPIIGGLACLAAGHFEILKDNLQHLIDDDKKENVQREDLHKKIKHCVKYHTALLRFVEEYEKCFSFAVFGQFLGSILVIGISCLQLSLVEPLSYNFFLMIILLSTFLTEIYLYSYYGTTLFEESNTLTNAIYMGKWYEYDSEALRMLTILMERSKRPVIITAGKVLDISVATFVTILKRSYSLIAVLKNY